MANPEPKIRGQCRVAWLGDTYRLVCCQDVQIKGKSIELVIEGPEGNLYLEVNEYLAGEMIDFLRHGLRELRRVP